MISMGYLVQSFDSFCNIDGCERSKPRISCNWSTCSYIYDEIWSIAFCCRASNDNSSVFIPQKCQKYKNNYSSKSQVRNLIIDYIDKVIWNFSLSLMIAEILFLLGIEYREGDSKLQCGIVAGLLHYTFLAAFAWMALEGIHLYLSLNQVFNVDNR